VFLPLSRGGAAAAILCSTYVMVAAGMKHGKSLTGLAVLLILLVLIIPDAAFSRLTHAPRSDGRKEEARTRVYSAAINNLDEYLWAGVGMGNFWGAWGLGAGFEKHGHVTGPHNAYIAATIYWGLPGLLSLLSVIFRSWICLPRHSASDPLALSLKSISLSLLLFMMVMHVLSAKQLTLGLGLAAGSTLWIWPGNRQIRERSQAISASGRRHNAVFSDL
jgi:hypothetical protein